MYHLFAGDQYYPSGGIDDYVGSYDTLEEAIDENRQPKPELLDYGIVDNWKTDWANIAQADDDGRLICVWTRFEEEVSPSGQSL